MARTPTGNVLKGTRGNDDLKVSDPSGAAWTIDAGAGDDKLTGGSGADTLLGGSGNDIIFGLPNDVRLDGGLDYDTLDFGAATAVTRYISTNGGQLTYWPDYTDSFAVASGFERVLGSAHTDWIFGNNVAETFDGRGGVDHLDGGGGNDVLTGGSGADFFEFTRTSSGADVVTDFTVGEDHLLFYGVTQPDRSAPYAQGSDLVVPWVNGSVTLLGLGGLSPASYGSLFTLTNGEITVPG